MSQVSTDPAIEQESFPNTGGPNNYSNTFM